MDEALEEKILEMPLSLLDTEETFANFLRGILSGEEGSRSIHLQAYMALRQAKYQSVTLQEFIDAARDEAEDPLYHDLTCSIDQFLQSDQLSHLHGKALSRGNTRINHLLVGAAVTSLQRKCESALTRDEKDELTREGAAHGSADWEAFLQEYVLRRLME